MLTLHSVIAAACVAVRVLAAAVLIVVHLCGAPHSDKHPFEED
jgi:hypothetical protein